MIKPAEKIILQDLEAFIHWSLENEQPLLWVLSNVGHDVMGVINRDVCFVPRTAGYADKAAGKR